jgi:sigma-54 specific flagellar transcriptional regulator A
MDDLPLLIEHFLDKHTQETSRKVTLDQETKRLLFAHSWPGNVRELENVIERGLALTSGDVIIPADLPSELRNMESANVPGKIPANHPEAPFPPAEEPKRNWTDEVLAQYPIGTLSLIQALMSLEEGLIRRAMENENGVQAHAADRLGLKRNVFKYKWDRLLGSSPNPLSEELMKIVPQEAKLVDSLSTLEEAILTAALTKSGGNQAQAADYLEIKRNILVYKVKKYPNLIKLLKE